jgi:TRAP-type C4-dicarboxylate transport system permease large subunit
VPLHVIFKGTVWMMMALFTAVALLTIFPQIALYLPGLMK